MRMNVSQLPFALIASDDDLQPVAITSYPESASCRSPLKVVQKRIFAHTC